MKKILAILFALFVLIFSVPSVYASYGQYDGETYDYSILIDKTVAIPNSENTNSGSYVDNLSPSDSRFHAGNDVWFKIRVKNTSDRTLTAVVVKDFVPTYILPLEGPGTWDLDNRVITWNAGDFSADEEKTYYVKMRVYDLSMLPSDKGLFCITNTVEARNNVAYDDDSSQICIEKTVSGVTKVPSAGPEMGMGLVALEMLGLGAGIYLKKRSA